MFKIIITQKTEMDNKQINQIKQNKQGPHVPTSGLWSSKSVPVPETDRVTLIHVRRFVSTFIQKMSIKNKGKEKTKKTLDEHLIKLNQKHQ